MLTLDHALPPSALLDPADQPVTAVIARAGGLWFSFERQLLEMEGPAIRSLRPRTGTIAARAAPGNAGNAKIVRHRGAECLAMRARTHCGFALDAPLACEALGFAVLYASTGGDAGNLLCIDPVESRESLILTEQERSLALGRRKAGSGVSLDRTADPGMPRLVFGHVAPDRLALMTPGAPAVTVGSDLALAPECRVLLACRRESGGLEGTYGEGVLADVILFPALDPCDPAQDTLRASLTSYAKRIFGGI